VASRTYSKTEIFRGPAKVEIDDEDVGVVGDVEVTIEHVQHDETGEPWGEASPHSRFHDGSNVTVRVPMKQSVYENAVMALVGHGASSGGGGTDGYVYFEDRPGRESTYDLKISAVQGKSGAGGIDAAADNLHLYAVNVQSMGAVVWSRSAERMLEVTFASALDTDRAAGRRIGVWNRPAAS
jgi:hypothetical protein